MAVVRGTVQGRKGKGKLSDSNKLNRYAVSKGDSHTENKGNKNVRSEKVRRFQIVTVQ